MVMVLFHRNMSVNSYKIIFYELINAYILFMFLCKGYFEFYLRIAVQHLYQKCTTRSIHLMRYIAYISLKKGHPYRPEATLKMLDGPPVNRDRRLAHCCNGSNSPSVKLI